MSEERTADGEQLPGNAELETGMTDLEPSDPQSPTETETDPEVERLTQDIERTRGDMTGTLEELGDRLNPANVIQDAKATVREATVGKVETMANDVGTTARETGEGIIDTIRRNPLPAALAGIGIGWLWMSRDRGPSWTRGNARRSWSTAYGGYEGRYGSQMYGDYGSQRGIGDKIGQAGEQVGETASQVAERARETAERVPQQFGEFGDQVGDKAQRVLEDNPLAVAGVALAVGAAVGMALPVTRTEERTIGRAGAQLIDQAATAVSRPMEELEDKVRERELSTSGTNV